MVLEFPIDAEADHAQQVQALPEEAEETEAEVLPKTTTRALMDVGIFTEAIPETVR